MTTQHAASQTVRRRHAWLVLHPQLIPAGLAWHTQLPTTSLTGFTTATPVSAQHQHEELASACLAGCIQLPPNNTVTTVTHLYQHSIHFFEHRQRRQRRHVAQSSSHKAPVLHNNGMQHLRCQLHDCCIHPCLLAATAACCRCCRNIALQNTAQQQTKLYQCLKTSSASC